MRRPLVVAALVVVAGCAGDNTTTPTAPGAAPTSTSTTTTTSAAMDDSGPTLGTIPAATTPVERPETTVRGTVLAAEGGDGLGDDVTAGRYPPATIIDLSPLPPAISEEQGRADPAAVAAQWVGLKVLTSGLADGPLWPYSVARHLPALSDPNGQYVANGRLTAIEILDSVTVDDITATATIAVTAEGADGQVLSLTYDIEMWRADDDYWLVAFAEATPR
ncbi:MAG: hypothetical protein ACK5OX_07615 [Desertimonas sp.]